MPAKDHPHKYEKKFLSKDSEFFVFKCQLPGCTHYVNGALIEGRIAECWRCGDAFTIDKVAAVLKKPHCRNCTLKRKKEEPKYADAALDLLTKMLGGQS